MNQVWIIDLKQVQRSIVVRYTPIPNSLDLVIQDTFWITLSRVKPVKPDTQDSQGKSLASMVRREIF